MQGTIQFFKWHLCLHPFAAQPPVQHVQTGDWLVIGDHVTTSVQTDESEVTRALDGTDLGAVVEQLQVLHWRLLVGFVARPLELAGPGEVAEPVADEVGVTGVHQHWDLLEDVGDEAVERLHPVALEEEVTVDVEVAAVVAVDLGTECLHHLWLVEVLLDPVQLVIAEAVAATLLADIVWVHAAGTQDQTDSLL
ncbi:Carboxypeptidase Y [Hortaea werneckii]|nr:Carboxypeptidase Y [Hortaea werneckii]